MLLSCYVMLCFVKMYNRPSIHSFIHSFILYLVCFVPLVSNQPKHEGFWTLRTLQKVQPRSWSQVWSPNLHHLTTMSLWMNIASRNLEMIQCCATVVSRKVIVLNPRFSETQVAWSSGFQWTSGLWAQLESLLMCPKVTSGLKPPSEKGHVHLKGRGRMISPLEARMKTPSPQDPRLDFSPHVVSDYSWKGGGGWLGERGRFFTPDKDFEFLSTSSEQHPDNSELRHAMKSVHFKVFLSKLSFFAESDAGN